MSDGVSAYEGQQAHFLIDESVPGPAPLLIRKTEISEDAFY